MEVKGMTEQWRRIFGTTRSFANDRRKLNRALKRAGINFEYHRLYDGYQWTFAYVDGDAIIHSGSHCNKSGYFETMGMPWDDGDTSTLKCKELIEKILEHKEE